MMAPAPSANSGSDNSAGESGGISRKKVALSDSKVASNPARQSPHQVAIATAGK